MTPDDLITASRREEQKSRRIMPRQRDPRIVNPASHPQKWVNFTVAGEYLDGMDRRAVSDYVTEGHLKAEWKGRRRKVHIDELVRFKAWLRDRRQRAS